MHGLDGGVVHTVNIVCPFLGYPQLEGSYSERGPNRNRYSTIFHTSSEYIGFGA